MKYRIRWVAGLFLIALFATGLQAEEQEEAGAWEKTKQVSSQTWDSTKTTSKKAWAATRKKSAEVWDATKTMSAEAWGKAKGLVSGASASDSETQAQDTPAGEI